MCAPSPPPPPNYEAAAVAQGTANKDAAIASSMLNNPNVVNPYGTQTFAGGENGGRPTLTQTFSPEQQRLYNQSVQSKELLGGLGVQGATALQGVVGKNLDLSGAPAAPGGAQQSRDDVIKAMMSRVNEDYGVKSDDQNSNLIAAGIRPGSKAYDDAQFQLTRGQNDARQQAIIAGGGEAQRDFNLNTQARKDAIAEILAQRQTPLNEINALMSGSQVSNPFAVPAIAQNANIAPPPLYNAAQQAGQYGTDIYNSQVANNNAMMGGVGNMGLSAAMLYKNSDRRLKSNIVRIGDHPLGIGIYAYDIDGRRDVGVMADEVLTVRPEAVMTMPNGFMAVDYGRL